MAEGQWAGFVNLCRAFLLGGGRELALGMVWGPGLSSSGSIEDWLSLFLLDFPLPSSKPSRWLSAAGIPPPTQPVTARWLLHAGLQAFASNLPSGSMWGAGGGGAVGLTFCRLCVGSFWGPVFRVLLLLILGFQHIWARCVLVGGQHRVRVQIVLECQCHVASPHLVCGPLSTLPQIRCETQGKVTDTW